MDKGERRYRTQKISKKRQAVLKKMYGDKPIPENKVGRCRKHHPYDCGNPRCYVCHCDKIDKISTRQEINSKLDMKEGME